MTQPMTKEKFISDSLKKKENLEELCQFWNEFNDEIKEKFLDASMSRRTNNKFFVHHFDDLNPEQKNKFLRYIILSENFFAIEDLFKLQKILYPEIPDTIFEYLMFIKEQMDVKRKREPEVKQPIKVKSHMVNCCKCRGVQK